MPEELMRSAVAADYPPGVHGLADAGAPRVVLAERRDLSLVHLGGNSQDAAFTEAVRKATGCELPAQSGTVSQSGEAAIIWLAPDRWLVQSTERSEAELESALAVAADADGAINGVTCGRTVFRASGPKVRDLLAQGCPIDLHPSVFAKGATAVTLIGHFSVTLHCVEANTFDIYVARSFAADLWYWLRHGSEGYGYRIEAV